MQKPSNTKARAQRELWAAAEMFGWLPPRINPRTLARWAQGDAFIPFTVLAEMTEIIAAAGGTVYDPEYFAKPRLPAQEATDA